MQANKNNTSKLIGILMNKKNEELKKKKNI